MKYIYYIIVICLTFSSCGKENKNKSLGAFAKDSINDQVSRIKFNTGKKFKKITIPSDLENILDFSEILDSLWYVPLETNQNSLIGKIDNVIVHKDYVYISDLYITKSVFIFNKEGKFINKISKEGHGPGEYTKPEFFYFDKNKNTIEITDNILHKIFIYDLLGNFIDEKNIPFRLNKYFKLVSGEYIIDATNRYNEHWLEIQNNRIFISDSLLKLKKLGLPYDFTNSVKTAFKQPNNFECNDIYPLYSEPFNDSIFGLFNDKIDLEYVLNFKNFSKTESLSQFESLDSYFKKYANNSNYVLYRGGFKKANNIMFIPLLHKNRNVNLFYNTKNNKVIGSTRIDMTKVRNGIFFKPPISSTKNYFISLLNTEDINIINNEWEKNSEISKFRNKNTIDFVSKIKSSDNPVLMFFKIKNVN